MVHSMTGFGKAANVSEKYRISVEIKAINHRYADINIKMPKQLNAFDGIMRSTVKEFIERGKLDIFITFEDRSGGEEKLFYNRALAEEYVRYLRQMAEDFSLDYDIRTSSLSRYPDVLQMQEADSEDPEIFDILDKTLREALQELVHTRTSEGEKLKCDLLEKLDRMETYVARIEERSPIIIEEYKNRLREKIQELLEEHTLDDARIATEVTIYADKICVDEEIVRLKSHISGMREILQNGDSIGRKLDFIAQEMNREANTILSKSSDLAVTDTGISLKTEIEKIREQVQNIE